MLFLKLEFNLNDNYFNCIIIKKNNIKNIFNLNHTAFDPLAITKG